MELVINSVKETGVPFEVVPIDPKLSDTTAFCEQYGFSTDVTANTLLVVAKTNPKKYAACVVLANSKLDVNHSVKKLMGGKTSFASSEEMIALTGMEVGAVTPFGMGAEIPIYIDERVMKPEWIILGAGQRDKKIKVAPEALLHLPSVKVVADLAQLKTASAS